jgi:hypothetical protein
MGSCKYDNKFAGSIKAVNFIAEPLSASEEVLYFIDSVIF